MSIPSIERDASGQETKEASTQVDMQQNARPMVIFPFSLPSLEEEISFLGQVIDDKPSDCERISQIYAETFQRKTGAERAHLTLVETVQSFLREKAQVEELSRDPRFQKPFRYHLPVSKVIQNLAREQLGCANKAKEAFQIAFRKFRDPNHAHECAFDAYTAALDQHGLDREEEIAILKNEIKVQNEIADGIFDDLIKDLVSDIATA